MEKNTTPLLQKRTAPCLVLVYIQYGETLNCVSPATLGLDVRIPKRSKVYSLGAKSTMGGSFTRYSAMRYDID